MLVQIFHVIDFKSPQKVLLEDEIYPVTLLKETGYRFLFFLLYQRQT